MLNPRFKREITTRYKNFVVAGSAQILETLQARQVASSIIERKQEAITNVRGVNTITNGENYRSESPMQNCNREGPPNFEEKYLGNINKIIMRVKN